MRMTEPTTRILLTGGTGFIGGHLLRAMTTAGWHVSLLVRRTSDRAPSDTQHIYDGTHDSIRRSIESCRPDCVVHLASLFLSEHTPQDLGPLIDTNIALGLQLLEAMTGAGVKRLVTAATSWQHFHGAAYEPMNLYAATKQAFEDLARYYVHARGLAAWHLRLYDTLGADDTRRKLFWLLNDARRRNTSLKMSPGEQRLNLLHVDDAAAGFVHAVRQALAASAGERLYALRHPEHWTLRQIVGEYQSCMDGLPHVEWGARPYRDREVMMPSATPDTLPGWQATIGVREAITQLAQAQRAADGGQ